MKQSIEMGREICFDFRSSNQKPKMIKKLHERQLSVMKAKYSQEREYGAVIKVNPRKRVKVVLCGMFQRFNSSIVAPQNMASPQSSVKMGNILPSNNSVCRKNWENRPSNKPLQSGVLFLTHPQSWFPHRKLTRNGR